ncbi:putative inner membrane protein [plant metagenome]|uniref:Probable membrane transporter protein n=2 Tax=root TaxID=1 RepID=A0A1C3K357_9BURK|nr:putative inner membrane protein [Orrella dioscoreae]SOE51824.1 putative inner membrane protein [Orrella dioscoreae]
MVVALGAVVAGFVQGLSGFAFGLVAMSLWAWTLDPALAAVLAVFGALTGQVMAAVSVRRPFALARLWPFLLGGWLGVPLGVALLPRLDVDWFKAVLGLLLVIWCPAMLMARRLPAVTAGGRVADGTAGMAGGIMSGIGGFAGALPTLWCTLRGFEKDTQRGLIQNFNLAMLSVTMATYLFQGLVTRPMLPLFAVVGPIVLLTAFLGGKVYIGLSEAAFRRVVLGLLTASGVAMLVSAVPNLLARYL